MRSAVVVRRVVEREEEEGEEDGILTGLGQLAEAVERRKRSCSSR
jgi:hypothetical protein